MTNPDDPRTEKVDGPTDQHGPFGPGEQPTEVHHTADPYQAYGYAPPETTAAYPTYQGWDTGAQATNPTQAYPVYPGDQTASHQQAWGQTQQPPPSATQAYPAYRGQGQTYEELQAYQQQQQTYQQQQWGSQPGYSGQPGQPGQPGYSDRPGYGGYGEAPPLDQSNGRGPHGNKWLIWLTVAVAAAVVVIGGIVFATRGSDSTTSTDAGPTPGAEAAPLPNLPGPEQPVQPLQPNQPDGSDPSVAPGAGGAIGGAGAVIGKIDATDGSTLTVDDIGGSPTTVKTDEHTSVVALSGGKVADLKVGDTVVVQGDRGSDGTIMAKIIISTSMPHGGFGN